MEENYIGDVMPIDIEDEMRRSYMDYAMSTIISRALPDVTDGLKPVHRRCLYAMFDMGVLHNRAHVKSARVVGEVMGKYHPHSDTAIYDTVVRLAQDFRMRHPLVDGQGNFGSVDGDPAAASRYTEVRMREIAEELLKDIEKETVDFVPNYDNSLTEPLLLPARFPNLLVNGSSGIAVGMATNIPPHNLGEICDAVIHLVDNPDAKIEDLMKFVLGPDFPTGGIILGTKGIRDAYMTGRGSITTRARAFIEPVQKGTKEAIIVNEIPYAVNKSALIEHIANLVKDRKIESISDIRDESDRMGMRIYIELKRGENAQVVLNKLFKLTRLTENFGVIMLAIDKGVPREMNLKQMLKAYIEHRRQVIIRRTIFDLRKAKERAHILKGLVIALQNIDLVVKIIKESRTTADASEALQKRLGLSEIQAKAILDMRLARLTGLERDKIVSELEDILKLIEYLQGILDDERKVMSLIKDDLKEIKEKYGDERRTQIVPNYEEMSAEDFIVDEEVVVSVTHRGYIKRTPTSVYRQQHRGGKGIQAMGTRDEDFVEKLFTATNHDIVLLFSASGKVYSLKVYEIPEFSRTARGMAIVNLIGLAGGDTITSCCRIREFEDDKDIIFATAKGKTKRTILSEYVNARKTGVIAINIADGDRLISAQLVEDPNKEIILFSRSGMSIRFAVEEVRQMGRNAQGVIGLRLREGDEVVGMIALNGDGEILTATEKGYSKRSQVDEYRMQHRGGVGIIGHKVTPKTGRVVAALQVVEDEQIVVITSEGVLLRTTVGSISSYGRATQGVRLMRVPAGHAISGVARVVDNDNGDVDEAEQPELEV
ncbi:MAG TPA: DNA gyrase subunit A [candidate division Zixibacteria bacterium]|nr:DNA gyrase subunit A [candidate division Zixibacteria bacterium]